MKFKSLEEQVEALFARAMLWKHDHVNTRFQQQIDDYITKTYQNQLVPLVSYITTMLQLIIINVIVDTNYIITHDLLTLLNTFNAITMMNIDVSITIYLARVIPLLIDINNILVTTYRID